MPETLDSLERYLGNGTIKGVGPATARRIVDYFGEETLYVLKFEPAKLAKVKGISENKAIEIATRFYRKLGAMANCWIFRKIWNRRSKC